MKGNNSLEGDCSPSLGPDRSVALPRKTRGRWVSWTVLIPHPEVELIYSTRGAVEAGSLTGLAVQDEPALGIIHYPVASVAGGPYGGEGSTHLSDLIHHSGVLALIGQNIQNHLAHIGHPAGTG